MSDMPNGVDPAILQTFGQALEVFSNHGYRIRQVQYDAQCFGNFIIDLTGRRPNFRIVRDRGEYRVEADSALSPPSCVYRDPVEFVAAVLLWIEGIAEDV